MMRPCLSGLGLASPPFSVAQTDAARIVAPFCCATEDEERRLHVLYRKSGVRTRRSVLLESDDPSHLDRQTFFPDRQSAPNGPSTATRMLRYESDSVPLGITAASAALTDAAVPSREVTHLITVSCTGFAAPGLDVALIEELGLRRSVERTHIGFMGCHGALIGLRTARHIVAANPSASVLLCCVELCSLHQQYGWRTDQIVANALFADGAAAALIQVSQDVPDGTWTVAAAGSILIPRTTAAMGWRVRDHGFEMNLSAEVPDTIREHAGPWLAEWLSCAGLSPGEIASWAVHPGGPRILEATAESLGLSSGQLADSEATLAEFGNMSSPTILFIVDRLRRRKAPRPCVALAFGPGLTMEAVVFQ